MKKSEEKLLFNYLDGKLSAEQLNEFNLLLKKSENFRNEIRKYKQTRKYISENAERTLPSLFETRVFNALNQTEPSGKHENFDEYLNFIFRKMLAPALIIILFLLSFNFVYTGEISINAAFGMPTISIEEALNPTFNLVME